MLGERKKICKIVVHELIYNETIHQAKGYIMTACVIGIDIGTSSSKAVVVDAHGRVLARAECAHQTSFPQPGWAEHDAYAVWWHDVLALLQHIKPQQYDIQAVCVSGIGPTLLACDAQGEPLRAAILYGVDMRASQQVAALHQQYGAETVLARCGAMLSSQAVGPKIAWLRQHEPDVWQRMRMLHMANSWIVHRLTGEYVLDHHSASQCWPLYDIRKADWIEEWCADIAPGLRMPRLAWPGDIVGRIHADAAAQTGLPVGLPVLCGTIDAWSEAWSVGVQHPGDVMLMYGTTFFVVEVLDELRVHPAAWGTRGVLPGSFTLAAGLATSGAVAQWWHDLVAVPYDQLVAEAARIAAGSDSLLVLPYFAGERTPIFDPDARGLISGLTLQHGRAHIYRAILEGTAFAVRHMLAALQMPADRRFVAVGGGTKASLWTQIVSDVTGVTQGIPRETIGAAYGDARLAAQAIGWVDATVDWNPIVDMVAPNKERKERYDELFALYMSLYPANRDAMHAHANWQRRSP